MVGADTCQRGKRSHANATRALVMRAHTRNLDGGLMNDANTAKARRLMTMVGLLIVDLAGERVALRELAAGTRRAAIPTKSDNYASDYGREKEAQYVT